MLVHSVDKYVNGRLVDTSNSRGWSQILAERWSHMPGELPPLTPRDTEVAMLLRGDTFVDRIGSGQRQQTRGHPGTVWLCPAGVEEEYINISDPMVDCLHIFLPGKPFADMILRDLDIDPARVQLRYEVVARDLFIEHVAYRIVEEMKDASPAGKLLIESLGLALSAHLVRFYSSVSIDKKETYNKPIDRLRLQRVEEFIDSHLFDDFTIADLAAIACMSVSHFTRGFRAATGHTPYEYVSGRRLDLAKHRLLTETTPIAEIAVATGFSSQANFTRAFRKAMGTTPFQMRAMGISRRA